MDERKTATVPADAPLPDAAIAWWGSPRVAVPSGGAWRP